MTDYAEESGLFPDYSFTEMKRQFGDPEPEAVDVALALAGIPELMGRMKDAVDQLEAAVLARIEADAYEATDPKRPGYPEWVKDTADGGDE